MSTPTNTGPADKGKNVDRSGLGKYVKRMSSVFKRERSSKSQVPTLASEAPAISEAQGQQPPAEQESAKETKTPEIVAPT